MSLAVVFASNNTYSPGVISNIAQIEMIDSSFADAYYIFGSDWSPENKEVLNNVVSNKNHYIEYNESDFFADFPQFLNNKKIKEFITRYSYLILIFPKFLELLDMFDKILILDADLIILNQMYELSNANDPIAWRASITTSYKGVDIPRPNAGLLLFCKNCPYKTIMNNIVDYIVKTGSNEIALSQIVYDLNVTVYNLPFSYNYAFPVSYSDHFELSKDEVIVFHCVGKRKFWNSAFIQSLFPTYRIIYDKYSLEYNSTSDDDIKGYELYRSFKNYGVFLRAQNEFLRKIPLLHEFDSIPEIRLNIDSLFSSNIRYFHNSGLITFRFRRMAFGMHRLYADCEVLDLCDFISHELQCYSTSKFKKHSYTSNKYTFYYDTNHIKGDFVSMVNTFDKIINNYIKLNNKKELLFL